MSRSLFVGREDLVDEIYGDGPHPRTASLYAVTGPPGVGKTTLISHLAALLAAGSHRVVRIGLQGFRPSGLTLDDEIAATVALQSSFDHFCDLVLAICAQVERDGDRRFRERVRAAKRNPIAAARSASVRSSLVIERSVNVTVTDTLNTGRDDAETVMATLAHEFTVHVVDYVRGWAEKAAARSRRLYVLMDEFDTIADDVISSWVLALVGQLRDAVVVLAGRTHVPMPGNAVHRTMSNFTPEECEACLRDRCGAQTAAMLGEAVHTFTGGNPQAVDIVAHLVSRAGPEQALRMIRSWSSAEPQEHISARLTELVDSLLITDSRPIPQEVSSALVVVRRFDHRLLADIVNPDDRTQPELEELYARVSRLPFVEPSTDASGEFNAYRIHEFVRQTLLRDLRAHEPARFDRLHTRALTHYQEQIDEVKGALGRQDPFLEAVRYKNVRWRHLYTEWLYHLGHVADAEERALARLLFADVYLDAFWWWGYLAPSAFCDGLLHEWAMVCKDEMDRALLDQLATFARAFPPGWGARDGDSAGWREVTAALLWIRGLARLDTLDMTTADPALRHLCAVTSLFLAEAAQSSGEGAFVADRWYTDAHAMFDTHMGQDWTLFQHAEMWWDAGEPVRAVRLLEGVEDRARRRRDHELLGRLAIFTAVREHAGGALLSAVTYAVLAVAHAFIFHIRQTPAPDEYSTAFHEEMLERASLLFTGIAEQATGADWRQVADHVEALLMPLHRFAGGPVPAPSEGRAWTASELAALLPPLPTPAELHDPASRYVTLARWVETTMRDTLARTVHPY